MNREQRKKYSKKVKYLHEVGFMVDKPTDDWTKGAEHEIAITLCKILHKTNRYYMSVIDQVLLLKTGRVSINVTLSKLSIAVILTE